MKTQYFLIAALFLSGCMTTKEHLVNGVKMYETSCNGTARTFIDCQTEASKKCAETGQHFAPVNSDGHITYNTFNGSLAPSAKRSLLYKCVDKPTPEMVGY